MTSETIDYDGDVYGHVSFIFRWWVTAERFWWDDLSAYGHRERKRFFGPSALERAFSWLEEDA
jgi:hypothetical protein